MEKVDTQNVVLPFMHRRKLSCVLYQGKGNGGESEFLKTKILESSAELKVFASLILGGKVTLKLSAVRGPHP